MKCQRCGYDDCEEMEDWEYETIASDVVKKFAAYHKKNPAWGAFHVCLDDGNWEYSTDAGWCLEHGDKAAAKLAPLLEVMTPTQREALAYAVEALEDAAAARAKKAKDALWSPDIDRVVQREMDKADGAQAKRAKEK